MPTTDQVTLYYREGSSDKVYQASLNPVGELFTVNFAYGRRGATLTTGTKTASPVAYVAARKIFTELVGEKKAKGYTEGEPGTPYQHSEKEASGILPQLLNPIAEAEAEALLRDDDYCAQEKFDGKHLLVRKQGEQLAGINKKGLVIGLPQTVADELRLVSGSFILDGEAIGDTFHIFDLLELNGEDLRGLSYLKRLSALSEYDYELTQDGHRYLKRVATSFGTAEKRALFQRLRAENREGIVFKRWDAPYVPGKPSRGGPQLKFKFTATLSAIVAKVNQQRSVELSLFQRRSLVACGNVTIPANQEIPAVGTIVEIRYLYAAKASGILYQPVYLGPREDVAAGECRTLQLKYKAE